ncbi:MAG: hypothetical protein E7675_05310 [Ruminococcaceae bacterium]|nr:hypothetical protein [Oscillospiraceae bacterium]
MSLINFGDSLKNARIPRRKTLKKLGTLKCDAVETTPVVFGGRLIRFEWIRNNNWGESGGVDRGLGCYSFVDMENEEIISTFAEDHSFGCCYEEDGKMYVCGVRGGGGGQILDLFVSSDLKKWESSVALTFPDNISLFNTSICKGDGEYIMAIEIGGSHEAVGNPFTIVFARSEDLVHWSMLDMMEYSYSRSRYTACPCIRYVDGQYYIIYLESAPLHRWLPYIVRTKDFKDYEAGVINPVMYPDNDDKQVICPERFTKEALDRIENAVNCNNSDFDMCYYNGKTIITYSWGNQIGKEFLAVAEYDGTDDEFLKSFFE